MRNVRAYAIRALVFAMLLAALLLPPAFSAAADAAACAQPCSQCDAAVKVPCSVCVASCQPVMPRDSALREERPAAGDWITAWALGSSGLDIAPPLPPPRA